jgi:hypothetical protein
MDEAFRHMGYGIRLFPEPQDGSNRLQTSPHLCRIVDAFRDWLQEAPDPAPGELEQALQLLPNLIYVIRQFAAPAVKGIPHLPGGAPSATTLEQRQKIHAEIKQLYDDGFRLGAAYKPIAKRYYIRV